MRWVTNGTERHILLLLTFFFVCKRTSGLQAVVVRMGIARSATAVAIRDNDAAGTAVNVTNNAATTVGSVGSIGTDGTQQIQTQSIHIDNMHVRRGAMGSKETIYNRYHKLRICSDPFLVTFLYL